MICVLTDMSVWYTLVPADGFIFQSQLAFLLAIWCCKDFDVSFLSD